MESALATTEQAQIAHQVSPMEIAQQMSERGASIEQMNQFFDFAMRVEKENARKAFNEAMAKFKADPPDITKNRLVAFKETRYRHATHDHVVDVLVPALIAVDIRHRWEMSQEGGLMTVRCILTHIAGHSESASLSAAYDQSGGKNSIQAVVSAKTYLERHTLLSVTGMTTKDSGDDDGAGGPRMDADALDRALSQLRLCANEAEIGTTYRPAIKLALEANDGAAMQQISDARNEAWTRVRKGAAA